MNYVEADKVVLRLTRREAREVLLALASRTSALLDDRAYLLDDRASESGAAITSSRVVDRIYRRIERSWETKWPEVGQ